MPGCGKHFQQKALRFRRLSLRRLDPQSWHGHCSDSVVEGSVRGDGHKISAEDSGHGALERTRRNTQWSGKQEAVISGA